MYQQALVSGVAVGKSLTVHKMSSDLLLLLSHKDKLYWSQMLLSTRLFWKLQWTLEVHKGHSLAREGNPLSEALTKTMTGSLFYFKQTNLWFKLYFKKFTSLNLWVLLFWNNTSCHFIRHITEYMIVLHHNFGYLGKFKNASDYYLLSLHQKTCSFSYLLKTFTKILGNFPAIAN